MSMMEETRLPEFARQFLDPRPVRAVSGGGGGDTFVAGTLTETNTGVPSGTSLSDLGSTTYDGADDGATVTAKRFTGRVTLDGVDGISFVNCEFDFDDYFMVSYSSSQLDTMTVTFDHCTFHGPEASVYGVIALYNMRGTTVERCLFYTLDNYIRAEGNNVVAECYMHSPSQLDDAHVDGIEMYALTAACGDIEVRDCAIIMGPPQSWDVNGGVTAALTLSAAADIDDVRFYRNLLGGGAYNVYVEEDGGQVTNVQLVGNRFQDGLYGYVTVTDTDSILYWEDNFDAADLTETGRILIPGLDIERPVP